MSEHFIATNAVAYFLPGQVVTVFATAASGRPVIEGLAEIVVKSPHQPGWYYVRFLSEKELRFRYIYGGDWQSDPEGVLEVLVSLWAANSGEQQHIVFQPSLKTGGDDEA